MKYSHVPRTDLKYAPAPCGTVYNIHAPRTNLK